MIRNFKKFDINVIKVVVLDEKIKYLKEFL